MALSDLTVYEYTTPSPHCVDETDPVEKVIAIIKEHGVRHVPVLKGNEIVGIISHRDFGFRFYDSINEELTAKDIMTANPYIVDLNTPLEDVAYTMSKHKIGSAIVKDNMGDLVGIFTSTDALNALIEIIRDETEVS